MSTIKQTQRAPLTPRDPSRHYVRVQADAPSVGYESPLPDYLAKPSLTDPSSFMYREESTDARETGGRQFTLLSCSAEDHARMLKDNDDLAGRNETAVKTGETFVRGVLDPNQD